MTFSEFNLFGDVDLAEFETDPEMLEDRLNAAVFETMEFMAYGMDASQAHEPADFEVPGLRYWFSFFGRTGPENFELKRRFQAWLLALGLRRYIELYSDFLLRLRHAYELLGVEIAGDHQTAKGGGVWPPQHVSFPELISFFERGDFGTKASDYLAVCLYSVNKARNVLVHDEGIVTEKKADIRGNLVLSWLVHEKGAPEPNADVFATRRMSGIRLRDAEDSEGGGYQDYYLERREQQLKVGASIEITTEDFTAIGQTFLYHGHELAERLKEHRPNAEIDE